MLLRFLCSLKTFLNYVTDVYMYLKVLGGISCSQIHSHFNRKTLVRALDLLSLRTCTNVNQIGAVVLGK